MNAIRKGLVIAGLTSQLTDGTDVDRLAEGKHECFINSASYEEKMKEGRLIADPTPQIKVRVGNSDGGFSIFFPLQSYLKATDENRIAAIQAGYKEADLIEEEGYLCTVSKRANPAKKGELGAIEEVTRIPEGPDSDGMKFIFRKLKNFFIKALQPDEDELQLAEGETDAIDVFLRIAEARKARKTRINVKLYTDKSGRVAFEKAWALNVPVPATAGTDEDDDPNIG